MRCGISDIDKVLPILSRFEEQACGMDLREVLLTALKNDSVYVLMPDDNSVGVAVQQSDCEYDGHFIGTKETAIAAIRWMFENVHDCEIISWKPPTHALERVAERFDKRFGSKKNELAGRHYITRSMICQQQQQW